MRCIIVRKNRILTVFNIIIALTVAVSLGITVIAVERSDSEGFVPVRRVDTKREVIALTVNVYECDDVSVYMSTFEKVKVTFFISEDFQENYPGKVKEIYENGHSIGILLDCNTSYSENELYDILSVRIERMARIIGKNVDIVRFGGEDYDRTVIKNVYALGLLPVQWSDDDGRLSAGDILLVSDPSSAVTTVKKTVAEGFETATVDEIILKNGFKVDCNGSQHAG